MIAVTFPRTLTLPRLPKIALPRVSIQFGTHKRLGGTLTIDKWRPEDMAAKNLIEARLMREMDAQPGHDHRSCGEVNAKGNREFHWSGPHCRYGEADALAKSELAAMGVRPVETVRVRNSLVNTGLTDYNSLLIGGGGTVYSNANANIGAGDSNTAVALSQVDLQALTGSTHRYTMSMDATYPTVSNGVLTLRATFAGANGNFPWQEVVFNNGSAGAVGTGNLTRILNRFLTTPGTKTASLTWQVTGTMTLS